MAPDPWLLMYDSTCHIAQEIAEKIQERNRCQRNGENSTKLNVTIRSLLQNLKVKIDQLKDLLLRAISTRQITQLEGDRRQNLVDDLLTRQRQLQASYKNDGTEPDVIRSSLMTGGVKRGVTNPWLLEETEETSGLGFNEIRQQQQRIIQEQDAGLDALSSVLSRQKQMGQEIGNELEEQNDTCKGGVSCNRDEDFGDEEDSAHQTSGETVLPNSQELFITLDPIPSQPGLPDLEGREGSSAANVSTLPLRSPSQRLVQIKRRKKRTRNEMFSELMQSSRTERALQNAWRQTMSESKKAQNE
ncbi:syntaxin-8 isoform X1 [Caretta caretta]|uniref:syntaxin-8 isoform X1 n=1 Tax=Caretta caretta TaxID=8467 RepID=UPI002094F42E|nr:syntaxin-8 isoform X1 [Caretta caretta]